VIICTFIKLRNTETGNNETSAVKGQYLLNMEKMKVTALNSVLFFIVLICLANPNFTFAQTSSYRFSFNKYTTRKGNSLNLQLLSPDYDILRKYPLIVFLHGSGSIIFISSFWY